MIPANRQEAVHNALQNTFGICAYEDIRQMTRGLSGSLVFKITVNGIPYLLRIIKTDSRDQPNHYFGCMQTAAMYGLAPKIHYLSVGDGISITDFIEEQPFTIPDARIKMADLVRHLHALPRFSSQLHYVDAADGFIQKFRASGIIAETEMETMYTSYLKITQVYPHNDPENLVSSHNDIKPDNIIFDGKKPWLVDWEAARLNDRYLDLAACANFVVKNEQDEADFLERYFGERANQYQQARFYLMSNIIHLFCFSLCTMLVAEGKLVNIHADHPGFADFHDGLWRGEINLGGNNNKLQYALVHLSEFQRKINTCRFDDSLRIIAASKARD